MLLLLCLRGVMNDFTLFYNNIDDKEGEYGAYKGHFVHIEGNATRNGEPMYQIRVGTKYMYVPQSYVDFRRDPANMLEDTTLRINPDPKSRVLKVIKKDSKIFVNDLAENDYLYIEYENYRGYIPAASCDHKEPFYPGKNDGEKAAKIIETKLGCPYVLVTESTGPFVFDCSGLMMYAYNLLDIFLNRTANRQIYGLKSLPTNDTSEWLPGDVITFCTDDEDPDAITHVGMYFGNGEFIHASTNEYKVRRQVWKDYPYKTAHVARYFKE